MIQNCTNGVYAFDAHFECDGLVALYIIADGGRAAIVDTANNRALPYALGALAELNIPREAVDYIFLTHVHLDHAGGAGLFTQELPNAKLVVHARGARHMTDPTKLLAGVREVYGAEATERMYGSLIPVPASRVLTPRDGEVITLGGRSIVCLDTPGHARHHMVYFDRTANAVFTGDAFGITYPGFDVGGRQSAFPTTSPVQFDPEAMHRSIDRIVSLSPAALYPTHFGEMRGAERIAADLHRLIDAHVKIVSDAKGDLGETLAGLERLFEEEGIRENRPSPSPERQLYFGVELALNAQGLCVWYASKSGAE